MVNDAKAGNANMKVQFVGNVPHLCLFATKAIEIYDELTYDYGDIKSNLPWRNVSNDYLIKYAHVWIRCCRVVQNKFMLKSRSALQFVILSNGIILI